MKQQTPFFITITSEVLRDKSLNPIEKLIFTEIMALTYSCGYCYASNSHFAEIFDRTPETISRNISNLQAKGYIYAEVNVSDGNSRKIYVKYTGQPFPQKHQDPLDENVNTSYQKTQDPLDEKRKHSNTTSKPLRNSFSKKQKTNKKEIPVSANFTHTQPTVKESLTIEPTCKETLQVESVAGHKNYIHNTQKKSGRDIYTIEFEEFWAKYCEIAKAKNYTAGDKKTANKCYLKVLQKRRHQDIMRVLTIYQEFILLAFENNKHASSWLNAIDWPDFENQIKQYETDIVNLKNKAKQKEQNSSGQKLIQKPVYEVSEEDKKKQEQELKEYANVKTEKPEFMEHFKSVLKNYFGSSHFSWIQSLKMKSINENEVVFMLQCQVYVDVIGRNKEKFEQVFNREFQGFYKEFDGVIKFVAWKI